MRIGGTEMVIKSLVEGTDKNLFESEILCIEPKLGPFGEQMVAQGIKVTNLHWVGGFDKKLILRIRKYIKINRIDILHCHQYSPWVYGVLAALFTKTKVIFTEHGRFYPDSSSWKRRLVNPQLNKATAHVTAISEATKQALVEYENFPEQDIQVIYNGIKGLSAPSLDKLDEVKRALGITEQDICLGTIARFDPIKNHLMMLRAFHDCLASQPNLKLVIVGDGEMRAQIEAEIDKLGIANKVVLTGYKTNPQQYLAIMDIFLLSSFSEGTSMTLLEAMSIGKPCVVTDAGGNKEVIAHNINGLVTPNDSQDEFAASILKIIQDPNLSEMYAQNSTLRFANHFDIKCMTEIFSDTYQAVLSR